MKVKILNIVLLISVLCIIAGCERYNGPIICMDCAESTFKQTYLKFFRNDEVFFIKGVALDVNKHGRVIKVVEDLKGNLAGKTSVFVWGQSNTSFCDNKGRQDLREDNITLYHQNDTLIMLITDKILTNFNRIVEHPNDYKTIGGTSVLKLSDGHVTGNIHYWQNNVSWKKLQEELSELEMLSGSKKKPVWWRSEEYIPVPFITACTGVYHLKETSSNPDNFFFIQGLVLGTSNPGYGKQIRIITDLKGNFPKETATITVWGAPDARSLRFDDLRLFDQQDTLLMLLWPAFSNNNEKQEDYTTFPFTFSVLKLSKNMVSGYITSCFKEKETMSQEEFQTLLNSIK